MTPTTVAAVPAGVELRAPAPPAEPAAQPRPRPDRISAVLAAAVLGLFVVGLVASASSRVTADFGDSHDGRNAGVWGEHSRSLRESGLLSSRLGTRSIVGDQVEPYANHPPLIGVEAAAAEAVLGERPWVTRLPAWAGSLASLVLAFLLLRACRLRPLAAAAGVVVGFGCPMFATYGTMLDTTMVSLPFGIAVLWLWQRGRTGRPAPAPVVALVSVLAALTSWLGLLTVVLVAAATVVPGLRRRRGLATATRSPAADAAPPAAGAAGFVAGAALGGVLVLAWIGWAYGSLQPLVDQFLVRTGESGGEAGGLSTYVVVLRHYWSQVFTPWQLLLAIPALVAAVQWRSSRPVAVVLLVGMAVWLGAFRSGAVHHSYWAYWMVVPLALGTGVMVEAGLAFLHGRHRASRPAHGGRASHRVALAGLAAGATALGLAGVMPTSSASAAVARGAAGGTALLEADYPAGQQRAWYLGDVIAPVSWIGYAGRRPAAELGTPAAVTALAATAPDELVLVVAERLRADVRAPGANPGCRAGVPDGQRFVVLSARVLAANLARPAAACA